MDPLSTWLIVSGITSGAKLVSDYINRPRRKDYTTDTSYLKRYIASLHGRKASREVADLAMQPALRAIGTQAARTRRDIGYLAHQQGVASSGIEAGMTLEANQQYLNALNTASEEANRLQINENRNINEMIDQATLQEGAIKSQDTSRYSSAQTQYRNQIKSDILGAAANLVSAGVQGLGARQQTLNTAKAENLIPAETTYAQLRQSAIDAGYSGDVANYLASVQMDKLATPGLDYTQEIDINSDTWENLTSTQQREWIATQQKLNLENARNSADPVISKMYTSAISGMSPDQFLQTFNQPDKIKTGDQQKALISIYGNLVESEQIAGKTAEKNLVNDITIQANQGQVTGDDIIKYVTENNLSPETESKLIDLSARLESAGKKESATLAKSQIADRTYTAYGKSLSSAISLHVNNNNKASAESIRSIISNSPTGLTEESYSSLTNAIQQYVKGVSVDTGSRLALQTPESFKASLLNKLMNYANHMYTRQPASSFSPDEDFYEIKSLIGANQ